MNYSLEFNKPFTKKGKPSKYLRILVALMDGLPKKKKEIQKLLDIPSYSRAPRSYYGEVFSKLRKYEIINVDTKGNWSQGEKYKEYIGLCVLTLVQINSNHATKIKNMFMRYKENSLDFLIKE